MLSCKEEAIFEHSAEVPSCLVDQDSFEMNCFKVVKCSDESKLDVLVDNRGRCVLQAKEEGDFAVCYQHSVQNPTLWYRSA